MHFALFLLIQVDFVYFFGLKNILLIFCHSLAILKNILHISGITKTVDIQRRHFLKLNIVIN